MGGGILQIASNVSGDSLFNDQNYTFFKSVYHKYTPFSIENNILNLSSLSDFGKKMEVVIPKVGDLLTDIMLVIDLPEVNANYVFTDRDEYIQSLENQYTFITMTDMQQYNENLYKLNLGSGMQVYLVRDSVLGQYQLVLPLLDATMFLTQGKKQKYSLSTFLQNNSQFFDNQYKLHTIKDLIYAVKDNISNIDYLNYAFQDKEFFFFIANLLNIKNINPTLNIQYFNNWIDEYGNVVKKYILRRPEIVALNTFIENMNQQLVDSIKINDYVFNYQNIFSNYNPLDYQYEVIIPIIYNKNFLMTYLPFENIINNKNFLYDYTSSFFSIFNRNYILVRRNNEIIGAITIKNIEDTSPLKLIVQPFRHLLKNNTISNQINNVTYPLYIYYGITQYQNEPINYAIISLIKNNINNHTEFLLDRTININTNDIIIVGINPENITPQNSYNMLYGIYKIIEVRHGNNTLLTTTPIEIDQLLLSDTLLLNSNTSVTINTLYPNYNTAYASNITTNQEKIDFINSIKNMVYTDVNISSIVSKPIISTTQNIINTIVSENDFLLTSDQVKNITSTVQTYIYDSYDVLYNYISKIYYKTIIKSATNQDYLNNLYYKLNYTSLNNIFSFIGVGNTTFTNLENGTFRYQNFLIKLINTQVSSDGVYKSQLSYINYLTTHVIDQYVLLSNNYNNQWAGSLLNIRDNLSDNFVKIINYLQYNPLNTSGRKTKLTFNTEPITVQLSNLTSLVFTYMKKNVSNSTISDYYLVSNTIPLNLITSFTGNSVSFDLTSFIMSIQNSFNLEYINLESSKFTYTTNSTSGIIKILGLTTILDNYSIDLTNIINNNTEFNSQLYGNNIILDYINRQHETMFGFMKNYELYRKTITRSGGVKYSEYQEDIIDQTPLLLDGTYLINYNASEYYPRFLYSKQLQLYQNIYQKVGELSQNYLNEDSYIYFLNNINYPTNNGYNYKINNAGPISYLDPDQLPLLMEPSEYSYNLLDRVSKYNMIVGIKDTSNFSFLTFLSELEEHVPSMQSTYLSLYWNNIFITNGVNTTTKNKYISALSGKDDGLFIYYIYKYLTELYSIYSDIYNLETNIDDTYFKTIYQLSPDVLTKVGFSIFSSVMNTTDFIYTTPENYYNQYNLIINNNQNPNAFKTLYESYNILKKYELYDNTNVNNQVLNIINEITNIFYYIAKITQKHSIDISIYKNSSSSNYPIIYKIHGSGDLVKIILASDHYTITSSTDITFTSTIAVPSGYNINEYYKVFNLSIHYDYMKYIYLAGYGGIQRDIEYPNKTLSSFYQKINNYITANISSYDFAFFYANQAGLYLPNMEGNIIQGYQAWINRSAQPYFYYYNTLASFYDMFFIYSGRSFVSEYYSKDSNNNNLYNSRPDIIRGDVIYSTRMAYGTRDIKGRLSGVGVRYNLLDQRLYGIYDLFNSENASYFDMNDDPIQIINVLNNLNQRFTDYQEFLTLMKYSINITGPYPNTDNYLILITQFKASSVPMTDLTLYQTWNDYTKNYYKNQNYTYSSIINGLITTIGQYSQLSYNILDLSSIGYELYNYMNKFYQINQRNFSDNSFIQYLSNSNYHKFINDLNTIVSQEPYILEKDVLLSDYNYRTNNYKLVELNFIDISKNNIFSIYQSDVSVFKELFKNILDYRQKNIITENITIDQKKLLDDYYSINDVTSLTFYDKFFKFDESVDYHLIPLIYHDLYNIQNASKTIVFYLNYLYSFLSNTSSKPIIADYDNPNLSVSYYFLRYLSSGVNYFLGNFHQLLFDNGALYPYKSVPSEVKLYNGNTTTRPKSFMYVFLLLKIQFRNYYYSFVGNAYNYYTIPETGVRHILSLNTFSEYPDIEKEITKFDNIIDGIAVVGSIDHLQNVLHPFFINKHIDNLLFIKDLLLDLENVADNASINTILQNNDNYVEFLNERTIVTNTFDVDGLVFGGYPYTLGVFSDYNYMGGIQLVDPSGTQITGYIEGNIILPSIIMKIYYYFISECFLLNQNELIGSSFQLTPMALGNTLGQITAKDWKNGLINLISEYLFLLLKSKKIIYQNSIYEITYNDLYQRLRVLTGPDRLNDILDMFINSLLKIAISSYTVTTENTTTTIETYLSEYEQFKISNDFSLITIKQNFNYSQYYRLMFALRQSLIGKYNNFDERVRFHNAYDYWTENNNILISDYQQITFNNINYMVRKIESENVLSGLTYYSTNNTNIPPNLFTVIIDYIISNITNSINQTTNLKYSYFTKYDFKNFAYVKNGYDVTMTLYNIYFNLPDERYNIIISTSSKTITGNVVDGFSGTPFSISYNNLPFGYQYNFYTNKLDYLQLLYQYDLTNVLENMFTIFQNIQDINKSLTVLSSYTSPYDPTLPNNSYYTFIHFPTFIESFIYYDFTSKTDPTKQVNAVILPINAKLGVNTLFNLIFTNWSEFYGVFFYVYSGINPTAADFLGSGKTIFSNGNYIGSLFMKFNTAGKIYLSITNGLIDDAHPFGSTDVAVNIPTPVTVSSISDGSLDNNYAIITIQREIKITLFDWTLALNINQLYTFVADNVNGENLTNAQRIPGVGDGPFPIEAYFEPGSNTPSYRINSLLTFPESDSLYIYVSDVQNVSQILNAQVFALIPNITKSKSINIVNDIEPISKIGTLSDNTAMLGVSKKFTIYLPNWSPVYHINDLYVYFANNINGLNLGNDVEIINTPQVHATLTPYQNGVKLSFNAAFKNLGNNYVYLTYNNISNSIPYGSRPVNFLVNSTNPIISTRIENITGILNQYIAITSQITQFTVTLGNWSPTYIDEGIDKLYIYTRDITSEDIYTNYIPINNLSSVNYSIVLQDGLYILNFSTTLNNISQLYVYLTYNKISSSFKFGDGLVNIQITNPPGDLVTFNYIDVIPPFSTDYINNQLITYTTNTIQIHANNYSPNYNIYKDIPNLLYIFLSIDDTTQNIYSSAIPIILDENNILNYSIYTTSVNPVFIFVSDNIVYGNGLISYPSGYLVNKIGPINGTLASPLYIVNDKQTNFDIQLINWDPSYAFMDNITSIIVFIGNDPLTPLITLGQYDIVFTDMYHLIFSTSFYLTPGTYNIYITDSTQLFFTQSLINPVLISDQIQISTLTPSILPTPTYTDVIYNGVLSNWINTYPSTLNLIVNNTFNQSISIDTMGNFTFTTQVTQYPTSQFVISDNITYGSGYLETNPFSITTIIGPINASINQTFVFAGINIPFIISLPNWNSTYPFTQLYVYLYTDNVLQWNFGAINIKSLNNVYTLEFSATISGVDSGTYTVYISDTDFNVPGYNILQPLTNQISVIKQIVLDHIDINPTPFQTYVQTTLTGYINNWISSIFPTTMYIDYTTLYDNAYYSDTVTVNEYGIFNYIITVNTIPGIIVAISDSPSYGSGILETNQLTLNNIIGPVNSVLTTTPYAIKTLFTTYNIILTNWNASYFSGLSPNINNLYIYVGSDINTNVFSFGSQQIQFDGTNYFINFVAIISEIPSSTYNLYLSDQDPTNIISPPYVNQLISVFDINDQIIISSITPNPIQTYFNNLINGTITNWSIYYPTTLYIFITTNYDQNTISDTVSINSDGTFSYILNENTLPGVTISIGDNAILSSSYIESNSFALSSIIGPVNASIDNPNIFPNKPKTVIITLNNWNDSYATITQLYIYIGSDPNTVLESYGLQTITNTSGVYTISFTLTSTLSINTYTIYISDTDPNVSNLFLIRQSLTNQINIINQLNISLITTVPDFQTYTNTVFNGTLSYWNSYFPTTMYVGYYSSYPNPITPVITVSPITINSYGTFSFTFTEEYYNNFNIYITDNSSNVYGNGYYESNIYTITNTIGPVNAVLNHTSFIQNKSLSVTLTLSQWNDSYGISQLYIYIGSDPNTVLESYGLQTITNTSNIFTITVSILSTLTLGTYDIYISDTDPAVSPTYLIRQLISPIYITDQIALTSITTTPTPFVTYTSTLFNGTLSVWNLTYMEQMYIGYYSSYPDPITPTILISPITINSDGTFSFTYTDEYYANFNIYITDSSSGIYGNGYYETNIFTITNSIGPINATINNKYIIKNINTQITLLINNWNDSYGITQLYVYLGSDLNTVIQSFGLQDITNTTSYTITFSETLALDTGSYTIYVSDTDPNITQSYLIRQQLNNQLLLINQLEISSITTTPTPLSTFTLSTFTGNFTTYSDQYPMTLYAFINQISYGSISIDTVGNFSFTSTITNYNSINVAFSDTTTYGSGYLESPGYNITTVIGPVNAVVIPAIYIVNTLINYTITLTNWDPSYNITQLYLFSSTDTGFSNLTLLNATPTSITNTNNIYTLNFTQSFSDVGPYYYVISDVSDPLNTPYSIYQTIQNVIISLNTSFSPILLETPVIISSPKSINNLLLWYDASEINGTYLNQPSINSNITGWINKVDNTLNELTIRNSALIFNKSVIFNNDGLSANVPINSFDNGISIFIIFKNTGSSTTNVTLFNRTDNNSNLPLPISIYNTNRDFGDLTYNNISTITSSFDIKTSSLNTIMNANASNTVYNEYINGTNTSNTTPLYYFDSGDKIFIGTTSVNSDNSNGFIGNISEILIFNRTLNDSDREEIEGYLAWKWTLFTNLPESHPYSYLNNTYVTPINSYKGIIIKYQIVLQNWIFNPSITNLTIQYNQDITNPINLTLINTVPITQDDNNNYIVNFNVQFSNNGVYYIYLTDLYNNIYKSISTPITITDGSSNITLTADSPTKTVDHTLVLTLNNWSSIYQINNVNVYYSYSNTDPSPTLLQNASIQYNNNSYFISFLTPNIPGSVYFYVIGVQNGIQVVNNNINIQISNISYVSMNLSTYSKNIFNPYSIPSLRLWLDANEISGTYLNQPLNGNQVSIWHDKSNSNCNAIPVNTNIPTFVSNGINGLPSIQLTIDNNYVVPLPITTFINGMFIYIVYQINGTPLTNVSLISRNNSNIANPFIITDTNRVIGNGTNQTTITSPINISTQTSPSLFNADIDSKTLIYKEYNLFQYQCNGLISNYGDSFNDNKLFIGNYFNGLISEILIFNEPLSQEQKYSVEGYLAYKWNLEMYLPLYHPLVPITPTIFTPLLFSSLQLWLDASNSNSIIQNNNNVTQWNDISYNKYNAVIDNTFSPITTGLQNSINTLVFNASVMQIQNANILENSTAFTLIYIINIPSNSNINSSGPLGLSSTPESFTNLGYINTSFGLTQQPPNNYTEIPTQPPRGWIIYTISGSTESGTTNIYYNGINNYTGVFSNWYYANQTEWLIGSNNSINNVPMTASLGEMLVFNEELNNNQRILIEGYLANKWGLTNLLPVSSPYISREPNISDFNNSINEPIMNLDASTNSNFSFDGNNNILTWIDLTANANSVETTNGLPILQTNTINNKTGVYFNNASMIPINNQLVLNNNNQFTIFSVGYINNNTENNPTIISSNQHLINIRHNLSNLNNQVSIGTNSYAELSTQFSSGIQNMNIDTTIPYFSVYINGNNQPIFNDITLNDVFTTNFNIGGNVLDINSFLDGYIHQILIYNVKLDLISRMKTEANLAIKWNVPTLNPRVPITKLTTYTGVNTLINIILDNWKDIGETQVYLGYNTSPDNITNLINIGPSTVYQMNNIYYVNNHIIFNTPNTYYIHILDQFNTEYSVAPKPINVSNMIINTISNIIITENQSFSVNLNNWKEIVNTIGLYSNQITNFNLSIGISTNDPSPTFVTNIPITYENNNYILSVPGLVNVDNKYLYFSITINNILIQIPPILINYFTLSMTIDRNYGILNENETYELTISSIINPFNSIYPDVYLYYSTISNATVQDVTLIENSTVYGNIIAFITNQSNSIIYFYISTETNFGGHTTQVGPINFIDSTTLFSNLDTYDTNTNTRNILLDGWSPYLSQVTNLNILSGSVNDYSNQTLYKTLLIKTFSPLNISNLSLWLDAYTNANFIFNSSNLISQWTDKTLNNNNASTSSYPIYDYTNKGVNFAGGNYFNLPNGTIPYNDESYHIFIVLTPQNTASITQFILGSMDNTETPTTNETNTFFTVNNKYLQSWNIGEDLQSSVYTPNQKQIVSFEYLSEIGRSTYINTLLAGTDFQVGNASSMYNNMIGGIGNTLTFGNLIHEIIIYNTKLSTLERQKVENYLKYKWDI